jgi:TetR/AcrR family transcriptional regulator, fatty acid metabolism regulator protein
MSEESNNLRPDTAGRREREKAQRRQAILAAAERVFAVHGFETATMEQIAREAEFATGTIYLYFKDKGSLYAGLVANKLVAMVGRVETAVEAAGEDDPLEGLHSAIRAQFEFHDHNRAFFEVLFRHRQGPPSLDNEDHQRIEQALRRHHEVLVGLIRKGQQGGLLRAGESLDYARALLGMMIHLTHESERLSGPPVAGKTDFIFDLFLRGAQSSGATARRKHS